jgi:glyoxylase-like metal-dependent hydrolase (beta-lactamase superfamily II)
MNLPPGLQFFERGWLSANNILFVDDEASILVDTGYSSHASQTLSLVQHALGARGLDRIINTHLHSDHCGGNAALQAHYGSHTSIPRAEAAAVHDWNEDLLSYRATGQQCPRFAFDATLQSGDALRLGACDWQVLAAPGHDPHSLMLYCPREGLLISADALWENGFGVVFPELEGVAAFDAVRSTLDLIAGLDVRAVIPGHGPIFTDVQGALKRAFARLDYLAADPMRNAQNGVKVLVKFRLLERRAVALTELAQWMRDVPLLASCNRRYLQMDDSALAHWVAQQLVRAGAARLEADCLMDC